MAPPVRDQPWRLWTERSASATRQPDARNDDQLPERHVDVDVAQAVAPRISSVPVRVRTISLGGPVGGR